MSTAVAGSRPRAGRALAWAALTTAAAAAGVVVLALWCAAMAAAAAAQTGRTWRHRARRPAPSLPALAACLPLGAAFGGWGFLAGVAVALAAPALPPLRATGARPALTSAVALPIGAGAAALVLARRLGLVEPLVLLASVGAMDVGAWVIGSAGARWEARAGGVAALVPVTVASAVVLVPKFPAEAPFVLAAVVALLAPLGVRLARYLTGGDATPHPALDRVDSLVLAGPAWVLAATALLRV